MSRLKWLVAWLVLAMAMLPAVGTAQERKSASADVATVEQALNRLVTAFENLDWQNFRSCFSEDATIFHPAAPNIRRIDTPDQFDEAWLGVFERIKKNSRPHIAAIHESASRESAHRAAIRRCCARHVSPVRWEHGQPANGGIQAIG